MQALTQIPVRQSIVVIVIIFINVLPLLSLASLVLQRDCARLVETWLNVLLAVRNSFILLHVTLQGRQKSTL